MSEHNIHTSEEHGHDDHAGMSKKKIWSVFFILLFITVIEFIIALWIKPAGYFGDHAILIGNTLYIALTLLKAFYIVAYFMHLKFEKLGLALSIIVPILFIIGLILVLTNENHHWFDLR